MVNVIIGLYYVVVLGWVVIYIFFLFSKMWGDKFVDFFVGEFFKMGDIV